MTYPYPQENADPWYDGLKASLDSINAAAQNAGTVANGKADTGHTHPESDVIGLGDALEGKADRVATAVGWTNIPLSNTASSTVHRVQRLAATGQCEIQFSVTPSKSTSEVVGQLPAFARPSVDISMAISTSWGNTQNADLKLQPDGAMMLFTGGVDPGSIGLFTTYTP